jgi:HSP20 family protein
MTSHLIPRTWGGFPAPMARDFASLWRDMDRMLDRIFPGSYYGRGYGYEPYVETTWFPNVELFQTDDEVIIRSELPGLKRDDIDINATDDGITFSGERKARDDKCLGGDGCFTELSYGKFARSLSWPIKVRHDKAKATLNDGLLEIRVPLAEGVKAYKPTKIQISRPQRS